MSRTFAYCRVSTAGQETENQVQEIAAAGFAVDQRRIVEEVISGSTALAQRKGFADLLRRMEDGDILLVTKLDRLGRDAIDVTQTVNLLKTMGIRVHCLALGGMDLTSSAGMMTMQVLNAVAQFERDLIIERTQSGLRVAKAKGSKLGRKAKLDEKKKVAVRAELAAGASISAIAKRCGISRATIMRARNEAI